jgi:trehalose 6-phosphate phosphatase
MIRPATTPSATTIERTEIKPRMLLEAPVTGMCAHACRHGRCALAAILVAYATILRKTRDMSDLVRPGPVAPRILAASVRGLGPTIGFLLDFDGTLADIVPRPDAARMRPGTRQALERLPLGTQIGVVSGRHLDDVLARVGMRRVWVAGSHGAELAFPDGARESLAIDLIARAVLEQFLAAARTHSMAGRLLVEDKGLAVAVHLRNLAPAEKLALVNALRPIESDRVELVQGIEVLELRAKTANKGRAARLLLDAWNVRHAIAIGDDATDEDMFEEVERRGGTTIKVGTGPSRARHRFVDPADVEAFLHGVGGLS